MKYQYIFYQVDRSEPQYLILEFPVENNEEFDEACNGGDEGPSIHLLPSMCGPDTSFLKDPTHVPQLPGRLSQLGV